MSEQVEQFVQQAIQALNDRNYNQVIELTGQAIAANPARADAYILRGIALAQTNQPDAATQAFRQSISLDPTNAKAYYNLATHQYQIGERLEALAMAREALRLDTGHTAARDLIVTLEQESGGASSAAPPPTAPTYGTPYERPGYAAPAGTGSLAFVEKMGGAWVAIAWVTWAVYLLSQIYTGFAVFDMIQAMLADPSKDPNVTMQAWQSKQGVLYVIAQIVSWLGWLVAVVWTAMDIMNRRGNWLWMIGSVCCAVIGLPLYLALGRKN